MQTGGLRLYCDEQRGCWLEESGVLKDGSLTLSEGNNVTATEAISITDRSDYYTGLVVKYTSNDAANVQQIKYAPLAPQASCSRSSTSAPTTAPEQPPPFSSAPRAVAEFSNLRLSATTPRSPESL